jgi:hypothetical protein
MALTRSIRITDEQRHKLHQLAETLGISPNATVGQLIDYAEVRPVTTMAAVPKLSGKENSRSAQNVVGTSATAVVG